VNLHGVRRCVAHGGGRRCEVLVEAGSSPPSSSLSSSSSAAAAAAAAAAAGGASTGVACGKPAVGHSGKCKAHGGAWSNCAVAGCARWAPKPEDPSAERRCDVHGGTGSTCKQAGCDQPVSSPPQSVLPERSSPSPLPLALFLHASPFGPVGNFFALQLLPVALFSGGVFFLLAV